MNLFNASLWVGGIIQFGVLLLTLNLTCEALMSNRPNVLSLILLSILQLWFVVLGTYWLGHYVGLMVE